MQAPKEVKKEAKKKEEKIAHPPPEPEDIKKKKKKEAKEQGAWPSILEVECMIQSSLCNPQLLFLSCTFVHAAAAFNGEASIKKKKKKHEERQEREDSD